MVEFIDSGMKDGGGVFVHCAMGKSRSATAVVAYLMWKYDVGWKHGLKQLCEGRAVCSPNPGFLEQLEVWQAMLAQTDEAARQDLYDKWSETRFEGEPHEWEARALKANL